jgi:LacI family transcriptional regulator
VQHQGYGEIDWQSADYVGAGSIGPFILSGHPDGATLARMVDRTTDLQHLLGRRHDWTPIALNIDGWNPVVSHLLELGKEHHWQFKSLGKYSGHMPGSLQVRGALVSVEEPDTPEILELRARGIPTVRIGRLPHPDDRVVPAVMTDRPEIGRQAADYFARRDFQHVAYVGREPWEYDRQMYDAFADRAGELGLTCHLLRVKISELQVHVTAERDLWKVRQDAFSQWLLEVPKPVGLLSFGDPIADRYCEWSIDAGLRVPEDVAIMGIGNDRLTCECAAVPLSSVAHDHERLSQIAVQILQQLMAGQPLERTTVMVPPAGIITRQSTDVLAAKDPCVVAALRFMWDHVDQDLSVDQIASQVGVSRRTLQRAFQRELGRGVSQEHRRRRLDRARELIRLTNLPIAEIAEALNFGSSTSFGRTFREAYGVTPVQYRRRVRQEG